MDKEITNTELLESINRSFSEIEKKMATNEGLLSLKLELKKDINDLSTEFKGFKKDTENSIEKIEKDIVELDKTDMLYDKQIEKLETKVFPELNVA
jgi:adenine-specific DNA methylase